MRRAADRHEVDRSRGAASVGAVWVLIALVLGFLVGMLVYRGKTPVDGGAKPDTVVVNTAEDMAFPDAKAITIRPFDAAAETLIVNPLHIPLTKAAMHVAQWQNATNDTLFLIVTGAPIGELIAPNRHSAAFHVCKDCSAGPYPYRIWHRRDGVWKQAVLKGPPTEPSIDVD